MPVRSVFQRNAGMESVALNPMHGRSRFDTALPAFGRTAYYVGIAATDRNSASAIGDRMCGERYFRGSRSSAAADVRPWCRALLRAAGPVALSVDGETKMVKMTPATRYYVDKTQTRKQNKTGSFEDCEIGQRIEAYVNDDGNVVWVKIEASD